MRRAFLHLAIILFSGLLFLSCGKKKWSQTFASEVEFSSSSTEVTIAGKQFVIDSLSLDLNAWTLEGTRLQAAPIQLIKTTNEPTSFVPSHVGPAYDIPRGTYTEMKMRSQLNTQNGLNVKISGKYYHANGTVFDVKILLEYDDELSCIVSDTDGQKNITIGEDNPKDLVVQIDIEELFSEINPGLWNAAFMSGNNVVVDDLNNSNIYNALKSTVGNSLIARFQ